MIVRLLTNEEALFAELADVVRIFYPGIVRSDEGDFIIRHEGKSDGTNWCDRFEAEGREYTHLTPMQAEGLLAVKRERKRAAKTGLFLLLREITGVNPVWGSLTGIRPTRLLYELMENGETSDSAARHLMDDFYVSEEKAALIQEIERMQRGVRTVPSDQFDLYIGIPFCVTRCSYCSFSSGELGNGKLVAPYVDALVREIRICGEMMREKNLRVRAAYMGGGTPTSISAKDLARILDEAQRAFPGAVEWTVEAGRPDTIDREKLAAIRDYNVGRISVNPQTFSDETLRRIGRAHTAQDTLDAFRLAREMGFNHINMDIIAALPGERLPDFKRTLDTVISLDPESVTVHSLAIKRSSRLHEELVTDKDDYAPPEDAADMIRHARVSLSEAGYYPYYLYRQKYMAGNLENTGYAKANHACLYNIGNMEKTARVLALGAGAVTKWLFDRERRIERAPNVRNIEEYINRVEEMTERKRTLIGGEEA